MTATHPLLDDRIAMVAACTTLGSPSSALGRDDVLTNREWNQLAQWLGKQQKRPADLLFSAVSDLASDDLDPQIAFKATAIAERASLVAMAIEQLEQVGIWTRTRIDDDYPRLWKARLKSAAPPVIFGTGPLELANRPSIAIVGSREITDELGELANSIGMRAASAGFVVVSGGANGSDKYGMHGALLADGQAVGVLPAGLARLSRQRDVRSFIANEQLCLISQVNPEAGFSVGNAMSRNRLIYTLSDLTIVIATATGSGGTWAGATENLKHGWVPLAIWAGISAPEGNQALVRKGGYPFSSVPADKVELDHLIADAAEHFRSGKPDPSPNAQLSLLDM